MNVMEQETKPQKRVGKPIKWIIIAISVVIAIVLCLILARFIVPEAKDVLQYSEAKDLWDKGNKYEAIQIFSKNPANKDSWDYIKEFYQTTGERIKTSSGRTVGLRADGTVVDTNSNYVVSEWTDIVQIASGVGDVLGLTSGGNVVILQEDPWTGKVVSSGYLSDWLGADKITTNGVVGFVGLRNGNVLMGGRNDLSGYDLSKFTNIESVAVGSAHLVGLKSDGTVVVTGSSAREQVVYDWTDIVEISACDNNTVGLKSDGTVVATGWSSNGVLDVSDWSDIVTVCAGGGGNIVGLKSDGTVVTTKTSNSKFDVSNWSNVVAIYATSENIVGLRADGTVLVTGENYNGALDAAEWTDIVAVSLGPGHVVGLKLDGTVVAAGNERNIITNKVDNGPCNVSTWKLFDNINDIFSPPHQNKKVSENSNDETPVSNFRYEIDEDGNAEITGSTPHSSTLRIPGEIDGHRVTAIDMWAFSQRNDLTSVVIPNSVTEIGQEAFGNCENLTSISIPDSVTKIGRGTFEGCAGLENITIPNGITKIEEETFANCTSLTGITIPNGVTKICRGAFYNCTNLTNVTIPNSVTDIGSGSTTGIGETIGYGIFENCKSLTSVMIPSSVNKIEDRTFAGCTSLVNITIPSSVTTIGREAFYGCTSLTNTMIPDSVTNIGVDAFKGCTGLTNVSIPNDNKTTQVTADELKKIEEMLNTREANGFVARNLYNQVEDIDLDMVFREYNYGYEDVHGQELIDEYLMEYDMEELYTGLSVVSSEEIKEIYKKYTGKDISDSEIRNRLSYFYSPKYDVYCNMHGDSSYLPVKCVNGIIESDNTYVITVDHGENYPDFGERKPTELTLKKNGDSYIFVSNIIKNAD